MKKSLSLITGLFVLLSVSCTQEKLDPAVQGGQEVDITFTAQLPGDISTKAYADGVKVTDLTYAVYNAGGTAPVHTGNATLNDFTANVHLKLVTGKTYDILFWAESPDNTTYNVALDGHTLTVNYDNMKANDDSNDAFYAFRTYEVVGAVNDKVELFRPFAQVNVGTDDLEGINDGSFALTESSMKAIVANVLDFATGEVSGEAEVEYKRNAMPSSTENFPVGRYSYLGMNYLLVGKDQTTTDIVFAIYEGGKPAATNTFTVSNVPVKRNFRTNIYGSLITDPGDFDVNVKPDFGAGDTNIDFVKVATIADVDETIKNGVYDIDVQNAPSADGNVIIPAVAAENAGKKLTINIPSTEYTLTFKYETMNPGAGMANLQNVEINIPDAENIVIILPESHVTFNGTAVSATVSTSETTFVVAEGAKISVLNVNTGNVEVQVGGIVEEIYNLSEKTIYLMGTAGEIGENIEILPKYVENGVDMGYGIPFKAYQGLEIMWAPVNVGYDALQRPYGYYFQFGRKDGQTYMGDRPESNYVQLTAEILGEDGVNDNPDPYTFYISETQNDEVVADWYALSYDKQVSNLWDQKRIGGEKPDPVPTKGVNDPCPEGWRLPTYYEAHAMVGVVGADAPKRTWIDGMHGETQTKGMLFESYYDGPSVFMPAGGCISCNGVSEERGQYLYAWTSTTPWSHSGFAFYQDYGGGRTFTTYRANAFPIRCVLENYKPETNPNAL